MRTKGTSARLGIACAVVLTGPASQRSVAPEGSFLSAALPEGATDRSGSRDTPVGTIHHHTASWEGEDVELSITATTLPWVVVAFTTETMLYRRARQALLGNYGGRLVGWSRCKHAGHECRMLHYAYRGDRRGMARLYLRDDTLVVVNATFSGDRAAARSFLASVR